MAHKLVRNRSLFPFGPFWDDVFGASANRGAERQLRPALDVMESDESIVVSVELPGMSKADVQVSIEDGVLTISGEKNVASDREDASFHVIERTYGSFARALSLPSHVAADKAVAAFKNGVLVITLPKHEQAKPKHLEIS